MSSFRIILYKQKTYSNGKHPVMGVLSHNSQVFRFTIDPAFTAIQEEWESEKECFSRKMLGFHQKNLALYQVRLRIDAILDKLRLSGRPFTLEQFKGEFRKKAMSGGLFGFFDQLIQEMEDSGKEGNKSVYLDTKRSLLNFVSSRQIELQDINFDFLKKYETFLRAKGCTDGGISVYLRTLRAVLNQAINRSYLHPDLYPFTTSSHKAGRFSISSIKSQYNPRALTSEELLSLKSFESEFYPDLQISYLYFMFSYFSSGMNFKDMALLRWENIHDNRIYYSRSKTKGHLSIQITEPIKQILSSVTFGSGTEFIFPILNQERHKSHPQISNRLKKCLKEYNSDLKIIMEILNIQTKLTSYTARHTFAQTLRNKGVSTEIISQKLDHKSLTTTKHYLKELGNSALDDVNSLL